MAIRRILNTLVAIMALAATAPQASAKNVVQKSYNALIQIGPSVTGVASFWMSDFPGAPDALNWIFPPWLPKKLYIVGAFIGQQEPPDGNTAAGQFTFGIDRNRLSFRNGIPPYHQAGGDTKWDNLASMWMGTTREIKERWDAPKYIDRDVDSIWIENDSTPFIPAPGSPAVPRTVWFGFNYLVDLDEAPPAAPTGWNPVFGPMVFEGVSPGWTNYTVAQAIDADWFALGAGTKTRVTFSADHISSAYIGARTLYTSHQAVEMKQLTFGGNAGATANSAGLIISDEMPFGIDTTNGVVVKFHLVDGSIRYRQIQPSGKSFYKQGSDDAANANGVGYTAGTASVNSVVSVEQFY